MPASERAVLKKDNLILVTNHLAVAVTWTGC